jgi:catechol 2,3-dioxygenase-like lactoylglutathione lyase family enzyme
MAMFDLDHVGVAVRDLDAAGARWRDLGFTLTEKSFHFAPPAPGAAPVRSGTGNHCMMLARGYLELIAVTDPDYRGGLRKYLARYEGLHLVALGVSPASAAAAEIAANTGVEPPLRALRRPFMERGRNFEAAFTIVDAPGMGADDPQLFAIEHHTREALWQEHLTTHANGARSLLAVTLCVPDPAETAERMAKPFGATVQENVVRFAHGEIEFVDEAGLARRFPDAQSPAARSVAAMRIGVASLDATADYINGRALPAAKEKERVVVAAAQASGVIVEFVRDPA